VIKKPQRRRPRPDLNCRAIGRIDGWVDGEMDGNNTVSGVSFKKVLLHRNISSVLQLITTKWNTDF
jgi:hypothetical protein